MNPKTKTSATSHQLSRQSSHHPCMYTLKGDYPNPRDRGVCARFRLRRKNHRYPHPSLCAAPVPDITLMLLRDVPDVLHRVNAFCDCLVSQSNIVDVILAHLSTLSLSIAPTATNDVNEGCSLPTPVQEAPDSSPQVTNEWTLKDPAPVSVPQLVPPQPNPTTKANDPPRSPQPDSVTKSDTLSTETYKTFPQYNGVFIAKATRIV